MKNVRRRPTGAVAGVFMLALVLIAAGCGSSSKKSSDSNGSGTTSPPARVDSMFVFGGPPECQERPLCLGTAEDKLYGLKFKEVKKLDVGGPVTSKALKDGDIQVGELFTGSSVIDPDFVLLKDDKGLQPADNPFALVRADKTSPDIRRILDAVSAKLTLEAYNKMATSIDVDKIDPKEAAQTFLKENGLDTKGTTGNGKKLTVGAKNLSGARALSEAYAQALENNGYDVSFKDNIGATEVIYGLLKNGDIDLYGEFTGTLLSTIYKKTPSPQRMITYGMVQKQAQAEDLDATRPAEAQDVNGFYVTKENADKYGLVNMSDLTKTTTAGAP